MESEKRVAYTLSETDCERFFDISGYVLSPKRSQIGMKKYEETVMLSHNIPSV